MYIILTCLLALNVTKEVLQGFVHINESIETTNANFTNNTQKMMDAVSEAIKQGRYEFLPYQTKAKSVARMTQKTYEYIDSLKKELIAYTEDEEGADTLKLREVEKLDDYDKPTFFLIGSDETQPKKGKYTAAQLKQNILLLADSLSAMLDGMKDKEGLKLPEQDYLVLKGKLKLLRPQENYKDQEGQIIKWEVKNFYNQPLAAVITNLSKMQGDIRNMEGEIISTFASAPGKLTVPFNEMKARIIPQSKYIQAGSPFEADVFLSASSTDFKEDNLQFVLGDMDTTTGELAQGAVLLPMDRGTGKISIPSGSVGHKEIRGWVKFKDGLGRYKYFRYSNEYIVANAAVAVSPDKMNVFYAGVENPITVSAAGVAPTDLSLDIKGCNGTVVSNGNGKYVAKVNGAGTCSITVYQRINGRVLQQGPVQVFRVKRIPDPPLRIAGKTVIGNLDLKANDARTISSVGLDIANFDFNATFKVMEFAITMGGPGMAYQFFKCEGNKLSDKAREAMMRLKPGCKVYFEDIKVQTPEEMRQLPMVKISVK